jgi:fatty acid desaturase
LEISLDAGQQIERSAPNRIASRRGSVLKYKADRAPILYATGVFALRVGLWFFASPLVCLVSVVPLAILGMFIAPINHHHQHVNTFRSPWLNRIYDLVLSLQAGIGPYGWVLHHNLGHHLNYLNQRPHANPDESRWTRADGSQMGRVEYSLDLLLRHQIDMIRVGRRRPKYLRYFLWMKLPLWGLIGLALWFRPLETVLLFIVPAFITLFHTIWATYDHHAGCAPDSHFEASRNCDNRIYNLLTGNLGLHTAHHKRPGLHWSLLPELHEEIRDQIPPDQIRSTFW